MEEGCQRERGGCFKWLVFCVPVGISCWRALASCVIYLVRGLGPATLLVSVSGRGHSSHLPSHFSVPFSSLGTNSKYAL